VYVDGRSDTEEDSVNKTAVTVVETLHPSGFIGLAVGKVITVTDMAGNVLAVNYHWYNYGSMGATLAFIR
jgi:hypothetical protein